MSLAGGGTEPGGHDGLVGLLHRIRPAIRGVMPPLIIWIGHSQRHPPVTACINCYCRPRVSQRKGELVPLVAVGCNQIFWGHLVFPQTLGGQGFAVTDNLTPCLAFHPAASFGDGTTNCTNSPQEKLVTPVAVSSRWPAGPKTLRGFSGGSENPLAKGSRAHQYGEEQHGEEQHRLQGGELHRQA
jgi:hypothetical protein